MVSDGDLVRQTLAGDDPAAYEQLVRRWSARVLALCHARLGSAWLGAVAMTVGLGVGLALRYDSGRDWSAAGILSAIPPVLVAAALGYAVLGTIAALATKSPVLKQTTDVQGKTLSDDSFTRLAALAEDPRRWGKEWHGDINAFLDWQAAGEKE